MAWFDAGTAYGGEVVDLLSSSDDDDVETPPATNDHPPRPRHHDKAERCCAIDLCSSSSSSSESAVRRTVGVLVSQSDSHRKEEPHHHRSSNSKPAAAYRRAAAAPDDSESYDPEEEWLTTATTPTATTKKNQRTTHPQAPQPPLPQQQGSSRPAPPLTHAAYYLEQAKRASQLRTRNQYNNNSKDAESDDDDDDALFQFDSGMSRTTAATTTRQNRNSHNPAMGHATTTPTSTARVAPRSSSSSSSSTANKARPSVAEAPPPHHHSHPQTATVSSSSMNRGRSRSAPPARPPASQQQRTNNNHKRNNDDDSDDDDDDLWNFDPGLLAAANNQKKSNPIAAAGVPQPNAQPRIRNPYAAPHRSSLGSTTLESTRSLVQTRPTTTPSTTTTRPDPFPYPKLTEASRQYPDLRVHFLLAFWKYGRSFTRHSHDRSQLDGTARRVTQLAVAVPCPIRSLAEYAVPRAGSVHANTHKRHDLQAELDQGGFPDIVVRPERDSDKYTKTKYYSIAEACLVVLLEHVEESISGSIHGGEPPLGLSERQNWLSLVDLIPAIDGKLRRECPGRLTRRDDPDWGARHYEQGSTQSMEFLQIHKLECSFGGRSSSEDDDVGPYIKRHSYQKQLYYELLPDGYRTAFHVRSRRFPELPGHLRSSKIRSLDEVDPRYRNICVGVDLREGGGACQTLHQMCLKIEDQKCPYFVGSLSIGDYVFFTKKNENDVRMDYLCPVLVERKSIQDMAMSIHDGRWTSQKQRMYQAQYVFGYDNCRMVYMIEGNVHKQMTNGGYIGARWYNVDEATLNHEMENLNAEGFEVLRTTSVENSMYQLTRFARQVAKDICDGTLQPRYTYAQFKAEVKKISPRTNFSYMAKDHVQQQTQAGDDVPVVLDRDTTPTTSRPRSGEKRSAASASQVNRNRSNASVDTCSVSKKRKHGTDDDGEAFFGWTMEALKSECVRFGLSSTGKRAVLVDRLKGPRPPAVWLERKQKKQWVPSRPETGGTALLVALHLHEQTAGHDNPGIKKDDLYVKAESLNISKNPFSGGTTQTGPYHYDGWSSMGSCLTGDPALVVKRKNRYKLTTSGPLAGVAVAKAMHEWCHELGICPCQDENYMG